VGSVAAGQTDGAGPVPEHHVRPPGERVELLALLLAGQRVYRVAVGQYLGPDHGQVTQISEQALQYKELLQDAGGGWRERRGRLALQVAVAGAKATLPEAAP
jgi:type IV pilus assembly protein PilO